MQDRYALKRHRGIVGEESSITEKIRSRMKAKGLRRPRKQQ